MPRSPKKKNILKPPPKDPPPGHPMYHEKLPLEVSQGQVGNAESLIISRAVSSGRKHGINLRAGIMNSGGVVFLSINIIITIIINIDRW